MFQKAKQSRRPQAKLQLLTHRHFEADEAYLVLLVGSAKKKRRWMKFKKPLPRIVATKGFRLSMPSKKSTTSALNSRPSMDATSCARPLRPFRYCCTIALGEEPQTVSCFMMANASASGSFPSNLKHHRHQSALNELSHHLYLTAEGCGICGTPAEHDAQRNRTALVGIAARCT